MNEERAKPDVIGRGMAGIALIFGLGFVLFFLAWWFNTPENLWLTIKPFPKGNPVDFLRAEELPALKEQLANVEGAIPFSRYAVALQDKCYRGQNNSFREDGFAHICEAKVTGYYGFDGDFRQKYLEFDKGLRDQGWGTYWWSHKDMLERIDTYHTNPPKNGATNLVSSFAPPSFSKGPWELEMIFAEKLTEKDRIDSLDRFQKIEPSSGQTNFHYENTKFVRVVPLFKEIMAKHDYMAAISVETAYFLN